SWGVLHCGFLGKRAKPLVGNPPSYTDHSRRLAKDCKVLTTSNTTNHACSISLPFFDSFGSVHPARLKQQVRRFPLFIFEILTSTRRLRVSGFWVALTQRTHSQRAIGVIPFHRSWIF